MGAGNRHPVDDAGPYGYGWRIHPWMGRRYQWVQCGTCGAQAGVAVLFCTIGDRTVRAYLQDCPTCDGTRWRLTEVTG